MIKCHPFCGDQTSSKRTVILRDFHWIVTCLGWALKNLKPFNAWTGASKAQRVQNQAWASFRNRKGVSKRHLTRCFYFNRIHVEGQRCCFDCSNWMFKPTLVFFLPESWFSGKWAVFKRKQKSWKNSYFIEACFKNSLSIAPFTITKPLLKSHQPDLLVASITSFGEFGCNYCKDDNMENKHKQEYTVN